MDEIKVFSQLIFNFNDVSDPKGSDPHWGAAPGSVWKALHLLLTRDLHELLPGLKRPDKPGGSFLDIRREHSTLHITEAFYDKTKGVKTVHDKRVFPGEAEGKTANDVILIGIAGKRWSGKSTAAEHLFLKHKFYELSFARPLKDFCCALFLWDNRHMTDDVLKEAIDPRWGVSPRQVLQVMGTDIMRIALPRLVPDLKVGKWGIWVSVVGRSIQNGLRLGCTRMCISDVRFPNEVDYIKAFSNGIVVRLERPELKEGPQGEKETSNHSSETALDNYKFAWTYRNDGTKEALGDFMDKVFAHVGEGGWPSRLRKRVRDESRQ